MEATRTAAAIDRLTRYRAVYFEVRDDRKVRQIDDALKALAGERYTPKFAIRNAVALAEAI